MTQVWGNTFIPLELDTEIMACFPMEQWDNARAISWLESGWNSFALNRTETDSAPCGSIVGTVDGTVVTAERSVGYFQINTCNYPSDEWQRYYNAAKNVCAASALWAERGWSPWYFSAKQLGLL